MNIVTKRVQFCAAHRLYNPTFSEEKNDEIFGPCANPYGHGHNYTVEVSVIGEIDEETGYIVDLKKLKNLLNRLIVKPCDHKHLNFQVDFLKGIIPSVENLAEVFFKRIEPEISTITEGRLFSVKVRETENNSAEYRKKRSNTWV